MGSRSAALLQTTDKGEKQRPKMAASSPVTLSAQSPERDYIPAGAVSPAAFASIPAAAPEEPGSQHPHFPPAGHTAAALRPMGERALAGRTVDITPARGLPMVQRCGTRPCAGDCTGQDEQLHRAALPSHNTRTEVPAEVTDVLRTPGARLNPVTRAAAESFFGYPFGNVRIHTDAAAAATTEAVSARAYTVGTHLVFGPGQYTPGTASGARLLAHELTHVVQQSSATADTAPQAISQPGDSSEMEAQREAADFAADQAAKPSRPGTRPRGGTGSTYHPGTPPGVTGTRGQVLQRAAMRPAGPSGDPTAVEEVLREPGRSLPQSTRDAVEPLLGHDFGQVRIHTDTRAAESARAVGASAYTLGRHIVFQEGSYQPETKAGRQLLMHELIHAVQQGLIQPPESPNPVQSLDDGGYRIAVAPWLAEEPATFEGQAQSTSKALAEASFRSDTAGSDAAMRPASLVTTTAVHRC